MDQRDKIDDMAEEYPVMKAKIKAIEIVLSQNHTDRLKVQTIKDVLASVLVDAELCYPRKVVDLSPPKPHDGRGPG